MFTVRHILYADCSRVFIKGYYDSQVKVKVSSMINERGKVLQLAVHSVAQPGRLYNHAMQIRNHSQ